MRFLLSLIGSVTGLILVSPIILLALPFWLVAWLTQGLARRIEPRSVPWTDLMQFEPIVGWKPRPQLDTYALVEDVFHLVTDDEGWRGKMTIEAADVVVVGDSFAFGQGMDEAAFFGSLADGPRIKAIGANGYNMVQELLWIERLSERLAGKLVIWMPYYGNDLYENLQPNLNEYRMPFVREGSGGWEVVTGHVGPQPWTISRGRDYYGKLAEMCCPTDFSQRAYSACEYLLERGGRACRESGARLVIMAIPDITQLGERIVELKALAPDPVAFDPALPDRAFAQICGKLDVPFFPLAEHLSPSDYKTRDVHWNKTGHRKVAAIIRRIHGQATDLHSPSQSIETQLI